jgi:hypothetical protein
MSEWAEVSTDAEGAILALDREKAYNKIAHDYLFKVLEKMEFPSTSRKP